MAFFFWLWPQNNGVYFLKSFDFDNSLKFLRKQYLFSIDSVSSPLRIHMNFLSEIAHIFHLHIFHHLSFIFVFFLKGRNDNFICILHLVFLASYHHLLEECPKFFHCRPTIVSLHQKLKSIASLNTRHAMKCNSAHTIQFNFHSISPFHQKK